MATLSNIEIQKRAVEEMQASSERDAICKAQQYIRDLAFQQDVIAQANKRIAELKGDLALITIKDYSEVVK